MPVALSCELPVLAIRPPSVPVAILDRDELRRTS
jgi:hypothetical protein